MDVLSIPNYYIKFGRPPRTPLRQETRGPRILHRKFAQKEMQEEGYLGIHDRFIREEKFRKNMYDVGRDEEMCREMDKLADEDHTHYLKSEEFKVYFYNWCIRSNTVGSDTMPVRHRPDFKQALSALRQLKNQEDTAQQQRWQSSSSSWWSWQGSWWTPSSYENHQEVVSSAD